MVVAKRVLSSLLLLFTLFSSLAALAQISCDPAAEINELKSKYAQADVRKIMDARYGETTLKPVAPADYFKLVPTKLNSTFREPTFGYEIKLVSQNISQINGERRAWNANSTRAFFKTHTWKLGIFDGIKGEFINELVFTPDDCPGGSEVLASVWWHPTNPDVLFYPKNNELRGRNVVTGADFSIVAFNHGAIGVNGTKIAGGDGHEPALKTNRILLTHGSKTANALVYDFDKNAVARTVLKGTAGSYRYENEFVAIQAGKKEPVFQLPAIIDYATMSASGEYVLVEDEAKGTMLYDLSGNEVGLIYEVNSHMDVTYYRYGGKLLEGMVVKMIGARATQYGMTPGDLAIICWEVKTDAATGKRKIERTIVKLLDWKTDEGEAGGGQYSALSQNGSSMVVAMNPSAAVGGKSWGPYYDEIVELSLDSQDPAPRRLAHHMVLVTSPTMKQTEAWVSPDGEKIFFKSSIGGAVPNKGEYLFFMNIGKRTCKAERDVYFGVTSAPGTGGGTPPVRCLLDAGWQSQDLGPVGLPGTACYDAGVLTTEASGADIWSRNDQFRFTYRELSGNGEIIARITKQDSTDAFAKVGVMIREKLTENSVNALMYIAPTGMWSFQRRTLEGATTVSTKSNVKAVRYPTWVRLVRSGSDIYAYFSADGKTWQLADAIVMNLPDNVYVGIAVTSHTNTKLSKAVVDNITVKAGATASMPVEVTNFNAIAAPDRARVELSWNTVTEINNDYFVVERSEDGSSFEPIDQIASLGNSTTTQSYTAFDAAPIEGIAYYRLRYNGKEGTFTYTSVIEVNYAPKPAGTMNIFPNPVPAGTAFSVDVLYPGVTSARLELRNLQGTIVATRKNLDCSTTKRVTFKETLTPGIYYLTAIDVTGAKKPFTMKVVIQ